MLMGKENQRVPEVTVIRIPKFPHFEDDRILFFPHEGNGGSITFCHF